MKIIDTFGPFVEEMKRKVVLNRAKKKKKIRLPPGWEEVVLPSGEIIYYNTKTKTAQFEEPKVRVPDLLYVDSFEKPSALKILPKTSPIIYEPLSKAFEDASFENADKIIIESHHKMIELEEGGVLDTLGVSKDDAVVLISYSYEAEERGKAPSYVINKLLAERNDNDLRRYRWYLFHLLKALRRLEPIPAKGITLYRGIDGESLKFDKDHYSVGNILTWPAFTSTSQNMELVYDQFLSRATRPILFEIRGDFMGTTSGLSRFILKKKRSYWSQRPGSVLSPFEMTK